MAEPNPNELMRRLRELEQENERLRVEKGKVSPNQLVVTESEYQGHPVLTFQRGNNRPFNLGLKKLEALKEAWPTIESFLHKHGSERSKGDSGEQPDDQI
jgi:hypothetical protein